MKENPTGGNKYRQPEVNIGLTGHVDHGKSTIVEALTGKWPATHSEELRRGITIKLGYANADFRRCSNGHYSTNVKCPYCGLETKLLRRVSFVDCPGHESLMAIMLAGATLMDGAILVVAADEPCPQPQTREHLAALMISGIKDIVVAQNKIELVTDDKAVENFKQIKEMIEGVGLKDVPIVPISALHKANLDVLIQEIERKIPTPRRNPEVDPLMHVARSFDVNRPGTKPENLKGGVIGGSVVQGEFIVGDEIEIKPGIVLNGKYKTLKTKIVEIRSEKYRIEKAKPGGLVAFQTKLDPSLTKADNLMGCVVGHSGKLPPIWEELELETFLFEEVVGLVEKLKVEPIREGEDIMITAGTATTLGKVGKVARGKINVKLWLPICAQTNKRVAIGRRLKGRWRLIGYGTILER